MYTVWHSKLDYSLLDISNFQVKVFYRDMNVRKVEEIKEYPSVFNLLNSLGGALSLWLGISFIALFEIVELVARLIHSVCLKCKDSQTQ